MRRKKVILRGTPIKQGKKFKNTGVMISAENMKKVESHLFTKKGRKHSIRLQVDKNKKLKDKKKTK